MEQRTVTKALVSAGAVVAFAGANAPIEPNPWFDFLVGLMNVGLISWLGFRQPGMKIPK